MGKRILVTGNLGTIGVPLVNELKGRGHLVFGCDLSHDESMFNQRADISNKRQLERVFDRAMPDVVYNLAAEFGRVNGEEYFEQLWLTNQVGNQNVLDLCRDYKAHYILAGSSEAYGDSDEMVLREDQLETKVPFFHNNYALSKYVQERQAFIMAQNTDINATVLRFFNCYGPGEFYSPYRSVVCLFAYRLTHGMPITVYRNYHRVFMYIDDFKRTLANVPMSKLTPVHGRVPVYNIGGSEYRSVEELAEMIVNRVGSGARKLINYKSKEDANVVNKRPDITRAVRDLDHHCDITLENGIDNTLEWMANAYGPALKAVGR